MYLAFFTLYGSNFFKHLLILSRYKGILTTHAFTTQFEKKNIAIAVEDLR